MSNKSKARPDIGLQDPHLSPMPSLCNLPGRSPSDLVHTASSFTWVWTHKFPSQPALGGILGSAFRGFYRTSKEQIHHRTCSPPTTRLNLSSFSWESQVPGGSISQPWWCAAGISSNATRNQCRWPTNPGMSCATSLGVGFTVNI